MAPKSALLAALLPALAAAQVIAARELKPPLRVVGRYVVDGTGTRAYLACVNWYGAFLEQMVVNGLNRQPLPRVAALVRELGFNCVRLPFSLDMLFGGYSQVPEPNVSLAANPGLQHLSPLEVFDETVSALTEAGVAVILNNHVSSNTWCCSLTDGEGLWYTESYSQDSWLNAMGMMAARYRGNRMVAGFDLRNEIRPSLLGSPTWGEGESASDWSIAAVAGAKEVVSANENMLVIVSGLYFSIFLCDVPKQPIHEEVPELRNRTIYTSHEYKWVNFHLVARAMIGGYLATLVFWWAGLWLLVGLGWRLGQSSCGCAARRWGTCERARGCLACCGRLLRCCRCKRHSRGCESVCAIALTATSLASIVLTEFVLDKCSLVRLVLSIALLFLAFVSFAVSLVLWMRLAVGCVQQAQINIVGEDAAPAVLQELAVRQAQEETARELHPTRTGGLKVMARSKRFLAFSVSGLMLCALTLIWGVYGTYEVFAAELDNRWGFLVNPVHGQQAPVWIGEFGTSTDDLWWGHVLRYIQEREVVGWAYWSLNGEKRNNESETFGLLMEDSLTLRHPWKLQGLHSLIRESEFVTTQSSSGGAVLTQ